MDFLASPETPELWSWVRVPVCVPLAEPAVSQ